MNETFSFINFEPSAELTKLARRIHTEISDLCPTDGTVDGEIHWNGTQFICRLIVKSVSLGFKVESKASESVHALQLACKDAVASISVWHKKRFLKAAE